MGHNLIIFLVKTYLWVLLSCSTFTTIFPGSWWVFQFRKSMWERLFFFKINFVFEDGTFLFWWWVSRPNPSFISEKDVPYRLHYTHQIKCSSPSSSQHSDTFLKGAKHDLYLHFFNKINEEKIVIRKKVLLFSGVGLRSPTVNSQSLSP
jgi:hypothetical protein